MSFDPYIFDEDHIAKVRSELYITVLEKKWFHKIIALLFLQFDLKLKWSHYSNDIHSWSSTWSALLKILPYLLK